MDSDNPLYITIQWLGGSDLELWVFIFPIKWGTMWSYQEFPNHILEYQPSSNGWIPIMDRLDSDSHTGTKDQPTGRKKAATAHMDFSKDMWSTPK